MPDAPSTVLAKEGDVDFAAAYADLTAGRRPSMPLWMRHLKRPAIRQSRVGKRGRRCIRRDRGAYAPPAESVASKSPISELGFSPAFRVYSGASRKPRMVIDYRRVNQVTVRATFVMPDSVSVKRASAGKKW